MKNGFTLVELLGVIVLLSVILLITTISVGSVLNESRDSLSDVQKRKIEEIAETYFIKEGINKDHMCISVEYLINKGYIDGDLIKDPKDREKMTGFVKVTYSTNQYSYKYQEENCE